jgi:hypothetical protein
MEAMIVDHTTTNSSHYVELTCGKKGALVIVNTGYDSHIRVIVNNAAHRVFRGMGRRFATVADAVAAYKTDAVKTMILAAVEAA